MSTKTVTIEFSPDMKRDNITFREPYCKTLHSNDELEQLKICLDHDRKHTKENYGIPGYIVNRVLNAIPNRFPVVWDRVDIMVASEYAALQYTLKQPDHDESISGIFVEYPPNTNRSLKMITRQSVDMDCRDDTVFSLFVKQQFSEHPDCDVFYAYNNYAVITFGNKEKTEQEDTKDNTTHRSTCTFVLQLATKLNITKDQTYRTKLATLSDVHGWLLEIRQNRITVSESHAIPQKVFTHVKTAILFLAAGRNISDISIEITDTSVTLVYHDRNCEKSTYRKGMFIDTPKEIEPLYNDTVVVIGRSLCVLNNDVSATYCQYVNQLFIDFPNYDMFYGYKNYAIMLMPKTTKDVPTISPEVNSVFEQNLQEEEENMTLSNLVSDIFEKPSDVSVHDKKKILFTPQVVNEHTYYETLEDTIADLLVNVTGFWPHDDICSRIQIRTAGTPRNLLLLLTEYGLEVQYLNPVVFTPLPTQQTEVLEPTIQQIHIDYSDSFSPRRNTHCRSWEFITSGSSVYYWQDLKTYLESLLGGNVAKITDRIYQMWKDDYRDLKFVLDDTGLTITSIGRHDFEFQHNVFIQKPDNVTIPDRLYLPTHFNPDVKTSEHYWLRLEDTIHSLLIGATDSWDIKRIVGHIRRYLDGVPHVLNLRLTVQGILVHIKNPIPEPDPEITSNITETNRKSSTVDVNTQYISPVLLEVLGIVKDAMVSHPDARKLIQSYLNQ